MGYDAATAGSVYGLYTFGVYALALPGGWIADRLIGQRRAVLYGGILIALGHYSLAVPSTATFYLGLVLIVFGTGLLKPNISAIVGDLYAEKGAQARRRVFDLLHGHQPRGDSSDPLICSWLGEPREGADLGELALRVRGGGCGHDLRAHPVRGRASATSTGPEN